jgi:hypothetical protein
LVRDLAALGVVHVILPIRRIEHAERQDLRDDLAVDLAGFDQRFL